MTSRLPDSVRLAIGTLTAVPVAPPTRLDAKVAAASLMLAPVVGAALGGLTALLVAAAETTALSPFALAVLGVAALAVLTRAIHLDGLADTADGLGSGRTRTGALELMRRGDIGPFGVVAVVLVLLFDVAALTQAISIGQATSTLVLACALGRVPLSLCCRRGVPAARTDGLGSVVAGTLSWTGVGAALLAVVAVSGAVYLLVDSPSWWALLAALGAALATGELVLRLCVRRFGGLTGDVLGAVTELATAAALVCLVAG